MTGNAIRLLRALVDEAMAEKQTVISRGRYALKVHGSRSGSVYAAEGAAGRFTHLAVPRRLRAEDPGGTRWKFVTESPL
jgi:hypothetical protein